MREDRRQIVPRRVGAALRRVGVSLPGSDSRKRLLTAAAISPLPLRYRMLPRCRGIGHGARYHDAQQARSVRSGNLERPRPTHQGGTSAGLWTRTGLCRHSNQSLFARGNSAGKRFGEARDWAAFLATSADSGRQRPSWRQSRGMLKTIPAAPRNRNCAGPGTNRLWGGRDRIKGPIDVTPTARARSRWDRADPCRR